MALPGNAFELQFGTPNPSKMWWVLPGSAQFQYQLWLVYGGGQKGEFFS